MESFKEQFESDAKEITISKEDLKKILKNTHVAGQIEGLRLAKEFSITATNALSKHFNTTDEKKND